MRFLGRKHFSLKYSDRNISVIRTFRISWAHCCLPILLSLLLYFLLMQRIISQQFSVFFFAKYCQTKSLHFCLKKKTLFGNENLSIRTLFVNPLKEKDEWFIKRERNLMKSFFSIVNIFFSNLFFSHIHTLSMRREKNYWSEEWRERIWIHEFNCQYGKGATRMNFFLLLSPEGERSESNVDMKKRKRKMWRKRCSSSTASSSWWLYIHTHGRRSIAYLTKAKKDMVWLKNGEEEEKKISFERKRKTNHSTAHVWFESRRTNRRQIRDQHNKIASRCVTIAQSFFYSFSHHFVNFLFLSSCSTNNNNNNQRNAIIRTCSVSCYTY